MNLIEENGHLDFWKYSGSTEQSRQLDKIAMQLRNYYAILSSRLTFARVATNPLQLCIL